MKPSAARAALIEAIEEPLTTRPKAAAGDRLRVLLASQEPEAIAERTVMVTLLALDKSEVDALDIYTVTYQVAAYYTSTKDVEDRIADDANALSERLWRLHTRNAGIQASTPGPLSIETRPGLVISRRDVTIIFRGGGA